jgi:transglutaminase-like putative cysteine protease
VIATPDGDSVRPRDGTVGVIRKIRPSNSSAKKAKWRGSSDQRRLGRLQPVTRPVAVTPHLRRRANNRSILKTRSDSPVCIPSATGPSPKLAILGQCQKKGTMHARAPPPGHSPIVAALGGPGAELRIEIDHETTYDYSEPVRLGPQTVRLRPRPGGTLREIDFVLTVDPAPAVQSDGLDAIGNRVVRLRFAGQTRHLRLALRLAVETGSPTDYIPCLDPGEARLPPDYPTAESGPLSLYLAGPPAAPTVADLARRLRDQAGADPLLFLERLNRWIYERIAREIRPTGAPQTAAETLARGSGACRDQTVLFVALCRAAGLAARFVSGYQDRSAMETDRRYLHAWPEVYLPGAGWYGYDPTRGMAVSNGHVALAAAQDPAGTLPVEGSYFGSASSRMEFALTIRADQPAPGG